MFQKSKDLNEMADTSKFPGRYVLESSDNFEEYMKEAGVGLITRKAAANIKVTIEIKIDGSKWQINQYSTFKNSTMEFELDKEFDDVTPDGRKFRSIITVSPDGEIVHMQKPVKEGDKESIITRSFADDIMTVVMQCGDVTCKRTYKRTDN